MPSLRILSIFPIFHPCWCCLPIWRAKLPAVTRRLSNYLIEKRRNFLDKPLHPFCHSKTLRAGFNGKKIFWPEFLEMDITPIDAGCRQNRGNQSASSWLSLCFAMGDLRQRAWSLSFARLLKQSRQPLHPKHNHPTQNQKKTCAPSRAISMVRHSWLRARSCIASCAWSIALPDTRKPF